MPGWKLVSKPRTSLGKARRAAEQYIADEIAAGNNISYFDVIVSPSVNGRYGGCSIS